MADATGVEVAAPTTKEPVLLGSAILGGVAAGVFNDIHKAMQEMSSFASRYTPQKGAVSELHSDRFLIFEQLQTIAMQAAKR